MRDVDGYFLVVHGDDIRMTCSDCSRRDPGGLRFIGMWRDGIDLKSVLCRAEEHDLSAHGDPPAPGSAVEVCGADVVGFRCTRAAGHAGVCVSSSDAVLGEFHAAVFDVAVER